MLKKLTQFYYPETIEEACKYLGKKGEKTAVVAGGTSEALRQDNSIEALVDISRVKELNYIRKDSSIYRIGATTPIQDIYKCSDLKGPSGEILKYTAGKIGSTLLRNSITAGGNLAAIFPWSDLPPVYLALDAEVVLRKGKPKRTVPVENLINERPNKFLGENEIIAEIAVPVYGKGTGTSFVKFAKTANDYSMITVATRVTLKSGKIEQARIALNAVTISPVRIKDAEKILEGQKPTSDLIAEAAAKTAEKAEIRKDFRASKEYKREVLEVLVRRSLEEALEMAKK
ncbi:MAG: aerobic carbon-monoxide dehydrogenase medium subunit [Clostridiales bacterium]|jgi:CO/xanthine dehydrogenase FAD-binding subunit|nr:aerobic carbon-monoxide dehydrogenase medium subunit [Clostridiales bacterium]MDN5283003.1 aerobic carbon-monoxide dehydrogenase medium subunit [Candidatus Ozemobacter sp.]